MQTETIKFHEDRQDSDRRTTYTCVEFPGVWPVGVAAVVVAYDEAQARDLLASAVGCEISRVGALLPLEVPPRSTLVRVLHDGDY